MSFQTDLIITLTALSICAALGSFSFIRHFKPHDNLKGRIIPWMIVCLACLATGFMVVVHLVNLLGWETGR